MSQAEVTTAQVLCQVTVTESLKGLVGAANKTVTSDSLNPGPVSYSPTGTPPVKYFSAQEVTLDGGGAATIDLTALPGTQDDIDATGLKLQVFRIRGRATNTGTAVNIAPGATNGYALLGAGNDANYPAQATRPWLLEFDDELPDVGPTAKNIALLGTAADKFYVELLVG
jgi:hypothetical protein